MSPMAKICGTLVRICLSTGMKPRSQTFTPATPRRYLPFGTRPTATSTRSKPAAAALSPVEAHFQPGGLRLDACDLGAEQDLLIARADALLERAYQVRIAAGHER